MVRAHDTTNQQTSFRVGPGESLIALPMEDGGTLYFISVEAAQAAVTDEMIAEAIALAGAWSDLADEDVEGELDRLRHEVPPSPPLSL